MRYRHALVPLIALAAGLLFLQACGTPGNAAVALPLSPASTSTVTFDKPVAVEGNEFRVAVLDLLNTGERFGLNGRIPADKKDSHYMLRLRFQIENRASKSLGFGASSLSVKAGGEELANSGICTPLQGSGDSVMCFSGASADVETGQTKELVIYYVVPKDARKIELKLR